MQRVTTAVKFYVQHHVVPSQLQLQIITNFQLKHSVITQYAKIVLTMFAVDFMFEKSFV